MPRCRDTDLAFFATPFSMSAADYDTIFTPPFIIDAECHY
jgi:hypothetical protein